jgi:hypothetical protein
MAKGDSIPDWYNGYIDTSIPDWFYGLIWDIILDCYNGEKGRPYLTGKWKIGSLDIRVPYAYIDASVPDWFYGFLGPPYPSLPYKALHN